MAAYRADIEIGVKGVRFLDELQNKLTQVSKTIEQVNKQQVVIRRTIAGAAYAEPAGPGGAGVTRASAVAAEASLRRTLELQTKKAAAAGSWATALQAGSRWLNEDLSVTAALLRANDGLLSSTNAQIAARKQLVKVKQFEAQQAKRAQRTEQLNESIALGVGFPLLFGGGFGSVAGSFAGSFAGKGFGGQIIGGALGQIAEDFVRSAAKVTSSTENITESLGLAGTKNEEYLKTLQDAGRETEAYSLATERLSTVVGKDGVKALKDLEEAGKTFNKAFAEISTSILALAAQLISGAAKSISTALEETALFRKAAVSTDPQIQQLIKQRQSVGAGVQSFVTGGRSDEDLINRILDRQRELDKLEDTKLQKAAQSNKVAQEELRINRLTQEEKQAQITLAQLGNDLTDTRVFLAKQELIEAKFRVEAEQELLKGTSDVNAQLNRRLALARLNQQREEALAAAAEKAARELERQRKEMERMAKLRRDQLSEAQRGFVLAELDLGVAATGTNEKARAQAEFDRRRAERMFEYTEALQKALSEEERSFLVAKQEVDIFTAKLLLNKELFDIDLQRSRLLNQQDPAATIQEEINLLAAKIQGKEEEYKITKMIADLELADVTDAADRVGVLQNLRAQNEAIEAQKQLWADIYTTVAGQLQQAITGLIDGTAEWGDLLSNILGSLGNLFLNAAFSGLGSALKLPGFAEGGFVTGPTRALIGEGGEPEYVIPASKMPGALARYASGMRGSSVIDGAVSDNRDFLNSLTTAINGSAIDASESQDAVAATRASLRETERIRENRMQIMNQQSASERRYERERIEQMASTPGNLNIKYESQVINNVEYVTRDQAERMAAQSALRGRELALGSLQNSVKTRKRVGIA